MLHRPTYYRRKELGLITIDLSVAVFAIRILK